jgi:hypothetical protein
MRNLGVWRRLGVVLSVLWFVGFGDWMWIDQNNRIEDFYGWQLRTCDVIRSMRQESIPLTFDTPYFAAMDKLSRENDACWQRAETFFYSQSDKLHSKDWKIFLLIDIASVALAWLLASVIILVGRWVLVGAATV